MGLIIDIVLDAAQSLFLIRVGKPAQSWFSIACQNAFMQAVYWHTRSEHNAVHLSRIADICFFFCVVVSVERLMKLYDKHKLVLEVLRFFTTHHFVWTDGNMKTMWSEMNATDKEVMAIYIVANTDTYLSEHRMKWLCQYLLKWTSTLLLSFCAFDFSYALNVLRFKLFTRLSRFARTIHFLKWLWNRNINLRKNKWFDIICWKLVCCMF